MKKFLVHAHVYYKELWDELASCIANFTPVADVYITTPHADSDLKDRIMRAFPSAHYKIVENRGYDIAPFFEVLSSVDLSQFEYVVKLHTKRNVWTWLNRIPVFAGSWRKKLLEFCSTKAHLNACIRLFEADRSVGMIAGHPQLIVNQGHDDDTIETQKEALRILGGCVDQRVKLLFVAGSMFMTRSSVLAKLPPLLLTQTFNPSKSDCHLGTSAHVLERVFGYAVGIDGMRITDWADRYPRFAQREYLRDKLFNSARTAYRATIKPIIMSFKTQVRI